MADITIRHFVELLCKTLQEGASPRKDLLHKAHIRGWLEDQDERFPQTLLDRRTAARIIHNFMRLELSIPDLADISPAYNLADIYTCHACVNHVAQIFCRNLIEANQTERDGKVYEIFDMLAPISEAEACQIFAKIKALKAQFF